MKKKTEGKKKTKWVNNLLKKNFLITFSKLQKLQDNMTED